MNILNILNQPLSNLYNNIRYCAEVAYLDHGCPLNRQSPFVRKTILTPPNGNPKLRKSPFPIYGITLAPASSSGFQVCAHRSPHCEEGCLGVVTRRARWNRIREARIKKTKFLFENPYHFFRNLYRELDRVSNRSARSGIPSGLRCNVLSDLPWYSLCPQINNYNIIRYEYTKCLAYLKYHRNPTHYTFSYSGNNEDDCLKALGLDVNVTVVCTKQVKEECLREGYVYAFGQYRPCLDGDVSEARWLDPSGHIVLLKGKGDMRSSPFLVESAKEFP